MRYANDGEIQLILGVQPAYKGSEGSWRELLARFRLPLPFEQEGRSPGSIRNPRREQGERGWGMLWTKVVADKFVP